MTSDDPYRLPKSIRPTDYRILIRPDLDAETFSGRVEIDVVLDEATNSITLNNDGLTVQRSVVLVEGNTHECTHQIDPTHERMELTASSKIDPGPVTVEIDFEGVFNDQLLGLYLSRYTDDEGREHKIATTQFEATHARKCFPCWDEPDFKATFAMSLEVDQNHLAIANGPEIGRTPTDDGRVRVDFAPTIPMSTYLVALVAGPLEATEPIDVDGIPLRVVHVPGKDHLTAFALEVGAAGLRYFTDYFGLPYPDRKIDFVAIPDFAFGAMENLGCIIFREIALLIDPDQATQPELQRTADVINHELAHMWFGDLVTMSWWNGLWLNEAFATFMEMRATDEFRPGWDRWTDFALSRTAAFDTDSLNSTRPVEYEVTRPSEAEGMFDILTYEKGAAVVRMLEQYLGEEPFRAGIQRYMQAHKFSNADTTDLWDALEEETGEPVRRIMESWIFQGGFPLVTMQETPDGLTLQQRRLGYAGGDPSPEQSWSIPLQYRWRPAGADEDQSGRVLIEGTEPVPLPQASSSEWVVLNARASGFFRVAYPADRLADLAHLDVGVLAAAERYGLVDDTWAAVLADQTSTPAFLNLIEAMTSETNRPVWLRIIAGFRDLKRLLDGEAEERLEEIAHDAVSPALAYLGLTPEPEDDEQRRQLRGDLVRAMGTVANDADIQEEAKRAVATGRRNPELVDPPLLAAAVDVVAANGDEADFNDFIAAWRAADTPQQELRYLGALCDFPDPDLVARIYRLILDGEVRSQNGPLLLRRAMMNRQASHETWTFVSQNWDRLTDIFSAGLVVRMLEGLVALDKPEDARIAGEFFAQHPIDVGDKTLAQILERQRVQVALRARESERLARFLVP